MCRMAIVVASYIELLSSYPPTLHGGSAGYGSHRIAIEEYTHAHAHAQAHMHT